MSFTQLKSLAETGEFSLPSELLSAEADRERLVKAASELRRSLPEYDGSTQANLNVDAIRGAESAADRADDRVRNFLRSNHSMIVVEHLRPAFNALLAVVRKSCPSNCPTTADAAVRVANGARDYLKLESLTQRYKAIMRAAEIIYGPGRDNHRMFADTTAGPDRNSVQFRYIQPRGPAEALARLLWLAHAADANPYLPTNAERDAALNAFQTISTTAAHSAAVNNTP